MSEELKIRLPGVELAEQASFAPASCGIYGIFNSIDNAFYVGSSTNIRRRLKNHLSKLRKNKHRNRDLQTRWNTTNESDWCFTLFELCTPEERFIREQHFIDARLSHFEGYNLSGRAGQPAAYQWTSEQREGQRKRWARERAVHV